MSNSFFRRLIWIFIFYLAEAAFGSRLGAWSPPLVLAAVVGIALEGGAGAGLGWGLFAGLLFEPFSSGPAGLMPFAYALAGWGTGTLTAKLFGESTALRAIWPCVMLIVVTAVEIGWGRPAGSEAPFWPAFFAALPLPRFIAAAVSAPWVIACLRDRPWGRRRPVYT